MTYQTRNWVGDGCGEPGEAGLSRFGRDLVKAMNLMQNSAGHESIGRDTHVNQVGSIAARTLRGLLEAYFREFPQEHIANLTALIMKEGVKFDPSWDLRRTTGVVMLYLAGGETRWAARSLLYALLAEPTLYQRFVADGREQLDYIEEFLRLLGPVHYQIRMVANDHVLAGMSVHKGDLLFPLLACANRDSAVFLDADAFAPGRKAQSQQLAFGARPRFCIGADLARAELRKEVTQCNRGHATNRDITAPDRETTTVLSW